MRLIKIQDIFIIMIVLIIALSLIILLFSNQDIFLDEEYLVLLDKVNNSNNETIFLCESGEWEIITPYDFYICGKLNSNIQIKK